MMWMFVAVACRTRGVAGTTEPTPLELDGDGDGWTGLDGDCDDADPSAFPGAADPDDDGVDRDCDGVDRGSIPLGGFPSATLTAADGGYAFGLLLTAGEVDGTAGAELLVGGQAFYEDSYEGFLTPLSGAVVLLDGPDLAEAARWDGRSGRQLGTGAALSTSLTGSPSAVSLDIQGAWVIPIDAPSGPVVDADALRLLDDQDSYVTNNFGVASIDILGGDGVDDLLVGCSPGSFEDYEVSVCVVGRPTDRAAHVRPGRHGDRSGTGPVGARRRGLRRRWPDGSGRRRRLRGGVRRRRVRVLRTPSERGGAGRGRSRGVDRGEPG
ncbi:MAG: hypothetical protein ABMB14_33495 [Myxococcota bacterium]